MRNTNHGIHFSCSLAFLVSSTFPRDDLSVPRSTRGARVRGSETVREVRLLAPVEKDEHGLVVQKGVKEGDVKVVEPGFKFAWYL